MRSVAVAYVQCDRNWVVGNPLPKRERKPFELKPPAIEEVLRRRELRAMKELGKSRQEQEEAKRKVR